MKKPLLVSLALAAMSVSCLTGCNKDDGKIKIGILQLDFPAVDIAAQGFLAELKEAGISYSAIKRAPGGTVTRNELALDLVSRCNYLFGLGTGNSQALKGAIIEKGKAEKSTLFFSAVTDPVDAGLVQSMDNGRGFVCGTSDMNPVNEQIDLLVECIPTVDKVGIFYTNTETNSQTQFRLASAKLRDLGITVVEQTCTGSTDIKSSIDSLVEVPGLDAIYIPTDNNIADNGTKAVSDAVKDSGILVVCGEANMLKECGAVTKSVDYELLGRMTGRMAVSVIKDGVKAKDIPVEIMDPDDCKFVMSLQNAQSAGVTLPQSVLDKCENLDD